ncbi:MAG TPA: penicillin-binding transpeptidase domain-containing protein [Longimicrobiales bacterium]|nr:penicillin-binding transpeptidase domain-containing protein [Longimicrobiales bacterium]
MYGSPRVEQTRGWRASRGRLARVALVVALSGLLSALYILQVEAADEYALVARQNRLRPVPVRAPRGTIYDRHGQVVAENVVGYEVQIMPASEDSLRARIARLAPVLGLDSAVTDVILRRWRRQSHLPVTVARDASPVAVARLQERHRLYPEVMVNEYPKRQYSAGRAVSNIVGYVNEIDAEELESERFADYEQGRWIGKTGLEREYEELLGGVPGVRYLEIDARGRIESFLPEELGIPPIPGRDLHLYLDLDLQRFAAELFEDAELFFGRPVRGGFAAIDPQTGGVLALYSHPTYDPNLFVGGIDTETFDRLNNDPAKPLIERASGTKQPPGSTFKLPVASMALQLGVITPEEYMPISCTGGMAYQGRYARCWGVHGRQNLRLGIKNSCDVYFYQVGIRIGLRRFLEVGTAMGFDGRTGLDLPTETQSIFPESPEEMERRWLHYPPPENEIMSLSIGQGLVTTSPLKIAQLFVPLARADAKALAPRLARTDRPQPVVNDFGITKEQIDILREGMRMVVSPGGTAPLTQILGWDFMGKTGTAQNSQGDDHGWFVGLGGPTDGPPEIVAALLIEQGLHGSDVSGWVGNAVNFYLSRKHGKEFVRYATPRERYRMGLGAWPARVMTHYDNLLPDAARPAPATPAEDEAG